MTEWRVGDRLARRGMPAVVIEIVADRGDLWQVAPISDLAKLGMKVGAKMAGGAADPCIAKGDGNSELAA